MASVRTFYLTIVSECTWAIYVYATNGSLLPISGRTVVFRDGGSGTHQMRLFRVPNEWQLRWSFNCARFGSKGNFIVDIKATKGLADFPGVNELTKADFGTEYLHQGGTYYLEINSECDWRVSITR